MKKIFENSNLYLQYCINDSQTHPEIISQLNNFSRKNCSDLCSIKSYKYIDEKNECKNNCLNDDLYKYDYNNICYSSCPNGTYSFDHNQNCISLCEHNFNYNLTECLETVPIGFYLNSSNLKTIDKCNIKCNNCTLESEKMKL